MKERFQFPANFLWGSATASYQVEGSAQADGKGPSNWDAFCAIPGKIRDGSSGVHACEHYRFWREDLDLMASLGLKTYRFSVSWPRVQPQGRGRENARGLDFYERLVDGMLERGIAPNLTLFHWDLPLALEEQDGFINRDIVPRFEEYAGIVARRLGDRVKLWCTFNEPSVIVGGAYARGFHAPGRKEEPKVWRQALHNILLCHGAGGRAVREAVKTAQVGIVLAPSAFWPEKDDAEHRQAVDKAWVVENDWWMGPLQGKGYPAEVMAKYKEMGEAPEVQDGDMESVAGCLDWLGVNYYFPARVQPDPGSPFGFKRLAFSAQNEPLTSNGWEVFPEAMTAELVRFQGYGVPLYLTENGTSCAEDAVGTDGKVHDPRRVSYLERHVAAMHAAIAQGVDLRGYYHWSLMDNFEWAWGYQQRFGLVHVDYQTYKRTPKDSAWVYKRIIEENS